MTYKFDQIKNWKDNRKLSVPSRKRKRRSTTEEQKEDTMPSDDEMIDFDKVGEKTPEDNETV